MVKILKIIFLITLAFFLFIIMIYSPNDIQLKFFITVFTISLVLVIYDKYKKTNSEYIKLFLIISAMTFSLRYFWWRTLYTLNFDSVIDAIGSVAIYFAEMYSFLIFLLGVFIALRLLERKSVPIDQIPIEKLPSVDIYIPTYNEPLDVIKPTVMMASIMDYPREKFNVYVLDDGGTKQKLNDPDPKKREEARKRAEEIKAFVEKAGDNVHYITREKNEHAKAGNINEALKKTSGDLILILDCDHVPTQDFLRNTVGFFIKNPKLFLVQTPHKFYNQDPIEKNLRIFRQVPNESEMFYEFIQKGLDFWNASFFCGSAAILRRKFLEEVGGIAGDTITEDAETALELHSRGYESYYYPKGMVFGLQPETFSAFIVQRSRWAQGMIQIFLLKNPLLKKGLKWYQKLGYLNANVFWFFGLARVIFLVIPLLFIFFDLKIYNATLNDVLAYAMPHFLFSLLISYYLYSRYRWPFFSEVYESLQSLFLLPAIISVIRKPRSPKFIVTPKGENIDKDFVTPFYKPIYLLFNITLISIIVGIYKYIYNPEERGTLVVLGFWQLFNLLYLALGIIVAHEKPEKRVFHRIPANDEAIVYINKKPYSARVKDLSLTGIWLQVDKDLSDLLKEHVWDKKLKFLIKDEYGVMFAVEGEVVNANAHNIRLKFLFSNITQEKRIVQLVYASSSRWQYFMDEKPINPIASFLFLVKLTFKDFLRAYKAVTKEFVTNILDIILFRKKSLAKG
ncbi:UDP-forming cellulose synthase catalytic subunit [Nautilia sp.]